MPSLTFENQGNPHQWTKEEKFCDNNQQVEEKHLIISNKL